MGHEYLRVDSPRRRLRRRSKAARATTRVALGTHGSRHRGVKGPRSRIPLFMRCLRRPSHCSRWRVRDGVPLSLTEQPRPHWNAVPRRTTCALRSGHLPPFRNPRESENEFSAPVWTSPPSRRPLFRIGHCLVRTLAFWTTRVAPGSPHGGDAPSTSSGSVVRDGEGFEALPFRDPPQRP